MKPKALISALVILLAGLALNYEQVFIVSSDASNSTSITIFGHGLGFGLGMGQWGALGLAVNYNESYQSILSNFYSPLNLQSDANLPSTINVDITRQGAGPYIFYSTSAYNVSMIPIPAGDSIELTPQQNSFLLSIGGSCSNQSFSYIATLSNPTVSLDSPSENIASLLELCYNANQLIPYRGSFRAVFSSGTSELINNVSLEDYVSDVVPAEMPPYWGTLGSVGSNGMNAGFNALLAQAVAARSYGVSYVEKNGAICDTSSCQNYPGTQDETNITTLAEQLTAGQVMVNSVSQVQETFYSASDGGYTAGGPYYPSPDPGDAICIQSACNSNHDWSQNIAVSQIESLFPQIGNFISLVITQRNSLGDWGGRVLQAVIEGTSTNVAVSGEQFALDFGLNSDWYSLFQSAPGYLIGYLTAGQNGSFYGFSGAYGFKISLSNVAAGQADEATGGMWLSDSNGDIESIGQAPQFSGSHRLSNVVCMAVNSDSTGIWLVTANATIENLGSARPYQVNLLSNERAVSCEYDRFSGGLWILTSSGSIISVGNSQQFGNQAQGLLTASAVAIVANPVGPGVWVIAADGQIVSLAGAPSLLLSAPIPQGDQAVSAIATSDGLGLEVLTAFGHVITAGDAPFYGDPQIYGSNLGGQGTLIVGMYVGGQSSRVFSPVCGGSRIYEISIYRTCLTESNTLNSLGNVSTLTLGGLRALKLGRVELAARIKEA
jgi:SpoIID/LytB domain protein